DCLQVAITTAEQQGALSFALRAATSLVESCDSENQRRAMLGVLEPIYGRFTEGLETPDLQDSRRLLRSTTATSGPVSRPVWVARACFGAAGSRGRSISVGELACSGCP